MRKASRACFSAARRIHGYITRIYMGMLHSWNGKYHQLYCPPPRMKVRVSCFQISPESMKRPQMKKKMSVFRCLICISSLPVQPSVSILLTL